MPLLRFGGCLSWESAKTQEIKDEEIKRIPDEALVRLLEEELGRPPGWTRTVELTALPAPCIPRPADSSRNPYRASQ